MCWIKNNGKILSVGGVIDIFIGINSVVVDLSEKVKLINRSDSYKLQSLTKNREKIILDSIIISFQLYPKHIHQNFQYWIDQ